MTASRPGTEAATGARPVGDDSLHPTVVIIASIGALQIVRWVTRKSSIYRGSLRCRRAACRKPCVSTAVTGAPMTIGWLTIAFFAGTFFGIFVLGLCQAAGQDTECPRAQRSSSVNRSSHQAEDFRYSGESAGSRADVEAA